MFGTINIYFAIAQNCSLSYYQVGGDGSSIAGYRHSTHGDWSAGTIENDSTIQSYKLRTWAKDADSTFRPVGTTQIFDHTDLIGYSIPFDMGWNNWFFEFSGLNMYYNGTPYSFAVNDSFCYRISIDCSDPLVTSTFGTTQDSICADTCVAWGADPGAVDFYVVLARWPHLGAVKEATTLPKMPTLGQNNPNPFNAVTDINFNLPANSYVKLEVTDVLGKHVATLIDGTKAAGSHVARWEGKTDNGSDCASGVYFYKLSVGDNFADKKKMTLVK